jgi:hypothetical protein
LRYCHKSVTGWEVDVVSTGGVYCSIALNSFGYPHIAFEDETEIKYASKGIEGWTIETVTSSEGSEYYISLHFDESDNPHICFHNYAQGSLHYAFNDGSYWWIETVDTSGGQDCSMRLDSSGSPHISYNDPEHDDLNYARYQPHTELTSYLVGPNVYLTWTVVPGAAEYWIYGNDGSPYLSPELSFPFSGRIGILLQGSLSWISPYPTGIPGFGWSYMVVAVTSSGLEICRSGTVG